MNNIPFNQKQPKYRIGERVKQGLIVGIESYPPDSQLGRIYGAEWHYTLMPSKYEEELEHVTESRIKPLLPQQMKAEIQSEINHHQQQLENLQDELANLAANLPVAYIMSSAKSPGTIGS